MALLIALGIGASGTAWAGMGDQDRSDVAVRKACQQLILDYASFRDQRRGTEFANLFAVDGVLTVDGQTFVGRKALAARFADAPSQRSRHMMSNIRITVQDAKSASAVSYALIFVGAVPSAAQAAPVVVPNFTVMGEYHDKFVFTEEGWRMAARRFIPAFVPE